MPIKPFNSVAGFSVGSTEAITIINANGNVSTGNLAVTGPAALGNIANVKMTGGTAGQFLQTDGSGNLVFATVGTASLSNGTSNVNVLNSGNINFSVAGNANVVTFTGAGANFNGNVAVTGLLTDNIYYANGSPWDMQQPSGSNTQIQYNLDGQFGASTNFTFNPESNVLTVTGNVSASNANLGNLAIANFFSGNANALFNVQGGNVVGQVGNALVAGTVYTNAQPNITSVGNLTSLTVTGNASAANLSTAGNIDAAAGNIAGNLTVGNLIAGSGSGGNITGANVITANTFVGNIAASNITGQVANALVAGTVYTNAQPNITSVGTLTSLAVTGNLSSGNADLGNLAIANFFSGNGSLLTAITGANVTGQVANALVAGTVYTAAQPNITSVGTLSSLAVTGNLSSGNADLGNLAIANFFSGNGSALSAITGANVTGQVANALVAGTVYTNAQPNITSVGTLSSLAVTGNISGGNVNGGNLVTANFVSGTLTTAAQPNITSVGILSSLDVSGNVTTSANLVTDLIVGKTSGITITATGTNQNITLAPTGTGSVDVSGKILGNLATPVASTDAATKQYVDDVAQGLHVHASCNAATQTTLATISGGVITYNNGASGVGATLTTTGSYTTIDGVTLSNGMRILVKNEATAAYNGIYVRTSSTVLTRATDFDTGAEIQGGDFTFVTGGTQYNSTGWVQIDEVTTVGTDPIEWLQFSGAGEYSAGTGLTLAGTVFSISNTAVTAGSYGNGDSVATFTVNGQGQLTAAANVAITANAANLSGTVLSSSVVTSSLTSVGTLGSLAVTGNVTSGNVYANAGTIGAANLTGTLTTAAQPNVTSVGTLTGLTVGNATANTTFGNGTINAPGNITAANFIGNVVGNISGNITVPGANTEVIFNNSGIAGASNAFTFSTSSNVLTVSGNVSAGNVYANAGTIGAANLTGTLTTAAQPNITSVGSLANLTVTGNVGAGNISATTANLTTANVTGNVIIGNSTTSAATLTTTANTAGQIIAQFPVSGVTGVEFLVKGVDAAGAKYSVSTVQVVTDGANVDYTIFGGVTLGGFIGSLSVGVAGGNLSLEVAPSTANSTVWTTQYRFI